VSDNAPFRKPAAAAAQVGEGRDRISRILQGWRMFASEPPRNDSMIYVDATTANGAHVDPYNELRATSIIPPPSLPAHMVKAVLRDVLGAHRQRKLRGLSQAFSEWLVAIRAHASSRRLLAQL